MKVKHTLTGIVQPHPQFESRILRNRRDVLVYLPPGYRRVGRRRYPVLYLHDGQNVFDAATSYAGVEWGVDETAQRLIPKNLIEPIIIVAIANTGEGRIHEYAPTAGAIYESALEEKRSRGLAKKYGQFLIEELKPFIDQKYRTRPEAEFTGLGGSSMGGLLTLSLGLWFPDFFRRLMVMSPAVWWDDEAILRMIEELDDRLPLRIWLDTGTNETGWERARKLRDRLVEKGWLLFHDLEYCEAEGADHNEAAWGARVESALRFLFPSQSHGRRKQVPKLVQALLYQARGRRLGGQGGPSVR
jgi:predicted alpha/beta superfamily hydrolase